MLDIFDDLQSAIRLGECDKAQHFAAQLARLQQRPVQRSSAEMVSVKVRVADGQSTGPAVPLTISTSYTVYDLKMRMQLDHDFAMDKQIWIINGKPLGDTDSVCSVDCHTSPLEVCVYLSSGKKAQSVGRVDETWRMIGDLPAVKTYNVPTLSNLTLRDVDLNTEASLMSQYPGSSSGSSGYSSSSSDLNSTVVGELYANVSAVQVTTLPDLDSDSTDQGSSVISADRRTLADGEFTDVRHSQATYRPEAWRVDVAPDSVPQQPRQPLGHQESIAIEEAPAPALPRIWSCPGCTLDNDITRPGCEACGTARPEQYSFEPQLYVPRFHAERESLEQLEANEQPSLQPSLHSVANRHTSADPEPGVYAMGGPTARRPEAWHADAAAAGVSMARQQQQQHGEQESLELEPQPTQLRDWSCPACTLVNEATRPGCEACGTARPEESFIEPQLSSSEREHRRLELERDNEQLSIQEHSRYAEQLNENYLALTSVEQSTGLVSNSAAFQCPICLSDIGPSEGVVLRECLHEFCRACLEEHVSYSTEPVVVCPYRDKTYSCAAPIPDRERKALAPQHCDTYLQRSLVTAEAQKLNNFHCQTPDCGGWCVYDDNNFFSCPFCRHSNCLTCKAIHEGMTCKQYQDDLKARAVNDLAARKALEWLERLIKAKRAVRCAGCQIVLQKKDGCDRIKCSVCKLEVCWVREMARWGAKDLPLNASEGLQCRSDNEPGVVVAGRTEPRRDDLIRLVNNTAPFHCVICLSDCCIGAGVVLQECLHEFCRSCLRDYIIHSTDPVIKCPYVGETYSCEEQILDREVKALAPDHYDKYLQRGVAAAEALEPNSFHCTTPNCAGWCIYEDDVNFFNCTLCFHLNCLTCKVIHEGQNCKQYQDDLKIRAVNDVNARKTQAYIDKLLNQNKAMKCPCCHVVLQKMGGCDWMKCSVCKTEICWATKMARWGPQGKGDTSGGCQCSFAKRCHPSCKGCH